MNQKVIFSKFSDDRSPEYAICTSIIEQENGIRFVEKAATTEEAKKHILHIMQVSKKLKEIYASININVNECCMTRKGARFPFINGHTLENEVDELLYSGKHERAKVKIMDYLDRVQETALDRIFEKTDEFIEVFGDINFDENKRCAQITNIDMILSNIMISDKWYIIDYEWTFEFLIPIEFVIYRIIHYYIETSSTREIVKDWNLFKEYGISNSDIEKYRIMEENFQSHILAGRADIDYLYKNISPASIYLSDIQSICRYELDRSRMQVFFSNNQNFCEEKSNYISVKGQEHIEYKIKLVKDNRFIRVDPFGGPCVIRDFQARDNKNNKLEITRMNGIFLEENEMGFFVRDPQIYLSELAGNEEIITICFDVLSTNEANVAEMCYKRQRKFIKSLENKLELKNGELNEKNEELNKINDEMQNMKRTKVWRVYMVYLKFIKKLKHTRRY